MVESIVDIVLFSFDLIRVDFSTAPDLFVSLLFFLLRCLAQWHVKIAMSVWNFMYPKWVSEIKFLYLVSSVLLWWILL